MIRIRLFCPDPIAAALLSILAAIWLSATVRTQPGGLDDDHDGLDDALEDALAERFAPIVRHGSAETSFPVSVEWWLQRTALGTIDAFASTGRPRRVLPAPLRQGDLLNPTSPAGRGDLVFRSNGTRSRGKRSGFFLENVASEDRAGEKDNPRDWVTYVHSYPNDSAGTTLQYWRAYAWNDAALLFMDLGHGGDWESIAVHLDSRNEPMKLSFLQHTGIVYETTRVQWIGTHPLVWSEEGGHSSAADPGKMRSRQWITQETWTGGSVAGPSGTTLGQSGGLRNVGEKSRPRNSQVFIQYSGLWGSRRAFFITSGYWGPAFNETDARCENGASAYKGVFGYGAESRGCGRLFIAAWCDGMSTSRLDRATECYATDDSY